MASLLGRFAHLFGVCIVLAFMAFSTVYAAPFAAIVVDARTGETLYSKNADTRLHPASLTKMLTLYITFEEIRRGNLSLDTMITVSKNASAEPPSRLGLRAGQKIALRYLIRAAAVKSANDAAAAIGDAIGGSPAGFAKRMNRTAKAIGMTNSTFKNANGLTAPGHLSTARDMNTLGRRLFYDFPEFYNIFSRRSTDAGMAQVANTNRKFLDSYKGADGIKTGYTVPAGFNLTASAERGNVRIIATIFGGQSTAQRNSKMAELLDLGFAKAPSNAQATQPATPEYQGDDLVASVDPATDDAPSFEDTPGGSAKTIRLVMAVAKSPRPKGRPGVEAAPEEAMVAELDAVDDATAQAMQEGIAGALAEAATLPPPGTLDAQSIALVEEPGVSTPPAPSPESAAIDLAMQPQTVVPNPPIGQVLPSDGATGTTAPLQLADAGAAEADLAPAIEVPIAAQKAPPARPVQPPLATELAAAEPVEIDASVVPQSIEDTSASAQSGVVDPSIDASEEPATIALAANVLRPAKRNAPIFEDAVTVTADPSTDEQVVVTRVSTSGGRYWGVNVGRFSSSYEAESALLKTQLTESATLNDGLRKVIKKAGQFDANFMGLSQEQADLACRRLQARAVQCFTIGP